MAWGNLIATTLLGLMALTMKCGETEQRAGVKKWGVAWAEGDQMPGSPPRKAS